MTLYEMTSEPIGQAHRPFEVHPVARYERAQARAVQRLDDDGGFPGVAGAADDRQAAAVHRDRRAEFRVGEHRADLDLEPHASGARDDRADVTELLDDPAEHQSPSGSYSIRTSSSSARTSVR